MYKQSKNKKIPRFIYFNGVDGSGKSTYVEHLIKELRNRGFKAKSVWLRFNYKLTKPVLLYCRLTGLTRRPVRGGIKRSVHDFYRYPPVGILVQYLHFIDTCFTYFLKAYLSIRFGKSIIICDRFVYDILADFMVEMRDLDLPRKKIAKLLEKLLPDDSIKFYLSVPKKTIIERKPIVLIEDEDFDFKYKVYERLESHYDFIVIDNTGDPQTTLMKIMASIGFEINR